ncbi:hypothetical protein PIB30_090878, partial [Stylosanthes scabra]|nr:hypothetical protein [Stylosanthes scabra]
IKGLGSKDGLEEMDRKHEKAEISQRSKNEKWRKETVFIGLEQTQTLWKDEFNIYNFHVEGFFQL